MIVIDLLGADELDRIGAILSGGEWADGAATAGPQAMLVKRNAQLANGSPAAAEAGRIVLDALGRSALFVGAALPKKVWPPLFSRYEPGEAYGPHVDNAILTTGGGDRLRADLAATLFLSDPGDYEGGALAVDDGLGGRTVRLAAGQVLLYPATSLHRVEPVTQGTRLACVFWVESLVRAEEERHILFELDRSVQALAAERGQNDAEVVRLTGVYHNLIRRWANA